MFSKLVDRHNANIDFCLQYTCMKFNLDKLQGFALQNTDLMNYL